MFLWHFIEQKTRFFSQAYLLVFSFPFNWTTETIDSTSNTESWCTYYRCVMQISRTHTRSWGTINEITKTFVVYHSSIIPWIHSSLLFVFEQHLRSNSVFSIRQGWKGRVVFQKMSNFLQNFLQFRRKSR